MTQRWRKGRDQMAGGGAKNRGEFGQSPPKAASGSERGGKSGKIWQGGERHEREKNKTRSGAKGRKDCFEGDNL